MTAPQPTCERVFDAMDELVEAMRVCIVEDPEVDADTAMSHALLRRDGISIAYRQTKLNEISFTLQVPMDTIMSMIDAKAIADAESEG